MSLVNHRGIREFKNYSQEYMGKAPRRGHGAISQSELGVGCKLCLSYCFLILAGQQAPVYLFFTTCRSLNCHVVPTLAASFLAGFEALRERRGAFMRDGVTRKASRFTPAMPGAMADNGDFVLTSGYSRSSTSSITTFKHDEC